MDNDEPGFQQLQNGQATVQNMQVTEVAALIRTLRSDRLKSPIGQQRLLVPSDMLLVETHSFFCRGCFYRRGEMSSICAFAGAA